MKHNVKLGDIFSYSDGNEKVYYRVNGVYEHPNVANTQVSATRCDRSGTTFKWQKAISLDSIVRLPKLKYEGNVPSGRSKSSPSKLCNSQKVRRIKFLSQKLEKMAIELKRLKKEVA